MMGIECRYEDMRIERTTSHDFDNCVTIVTHCLLRLPQKQWHSPERHRLDLTMM